MRHSALDRRWGRTVAWLLVGLLIGGAAGAGTVYVLKRGKAGIPGGPRLGAAEELAMVPPDSIGFVHIRARDIWKSEDLSELRKVLDKAGPDALKLLQEGFIPDPTTLDRATLVLLDNPNGPKHTEPALGNGKRGVQPMPSGPPFVGPEQPLVVGILAFTAPFDQGQVKSAYLKEAVAKSDNGKDYFVDAGRGIGVYFPSDKVIVVGMAAGVTEFVKKQKADGKLPAGPLTRPLTLASEGGRHIVGALNRRAFQVNVEAFPSELSVGGTDLILLGKELLPILSAESFGFAVGVAGEDSRIEIRGYYTNEKEAEAAEAGIRSAAAFGRKRLGELKKNFDQALKGPTGQKPPRPLEELPRALLTYAGVGGVNSLDDFLANLPLKREGTEVVLSADKPTITNVVVSGYATVLGMLFDSVGKVRHAAARASGSNNLRQIGLGLHSYHDANNSFPSQDGKMKPGDKGGLSWRVHILPFIEQGALYKEFKLDEPWDSPNNKKLIGKMPQTYVSPLAAAPPGETFYQSFVGKGAFFEPGKTLKIFDITDGTSNTIMAIEGGKPVIWTKPDDIPFNGKIDPKSLMLPDQPFGINVLMADGSSRFINLNSISAAKLSAAITRAGGEPIFLDDPDGPGDAIPSFTVPKAPGEAAPKPKNAPPLPTSKGGAKSSPPVKK